MIKDPFGKEELYRAWMNCRYFIFNDISKYKIKSEIEIYDKYINEIVLDLYNNLKLKKFQFYQKQIFLMPKSSGLLRRNTFIAVPDQIVSHAILNFIGKKVDSKFYYWSCANRFPRKSTNYQAQTFIPYLKQYNKFLKHTIHKIGEGNYWVCETDIVSYFDHIDHEILLNKLKVHLRSEKYDYITDVLIPLFLRNKHSNNDEQDNSEKGIPQGGALSYFLSNVYLNELDHNMKDYTNIRYLRYVDDIRILGKSKQEVEKYLLHLQALLWELGLEINSGKTTIDKVENKSDLEDFINEQNEKLSLINKTEQTKKEKIKSFELIMKNNNNQLESSPNMFNELSKLRKRKVNFSISNLINNGDPNAFPYLLSQLESKPEKASYLLEKLFHFRYKEKKMNVLKTNEYFLSRPYESHVGAALSNLMSWGNLEYQKFPSYIPSISGLIELYLLNNRQLTTDPLIVMVIIKKINSSLVGTSPYLINNILCHLSKNKIFSRKYKAAFVIKLLNNQLYRNNNTSHFIANLLIEDELLVEELKNINNKELNAFTNYLKENNRTLYEMIQSNDEKSITAIKPEKAYSTLEDVHQNLNSVNDIFKILHLIIDAINDDKNYFHNQVYINPKNIWIKYSLYNDFEVLLNPNPIKDSRIYLASPEDYLDRSNTDPQSKVSFVTGILIFSTLLKKMDDIYKLYLPYLQFNPISVWKENMDYFKNSFNTQTVTGETISNSIEDLLNIIKLLTRKNPNSRLKSTQFNKYIATNQSKEENPTMKFFISHSTIDKGRINLYTNTISKITDHEIIIDHERFRYGQIISNEIKNFIQQSDMVIVFYSKNVAKNPKWIIDEVEYAIKINKPFVCVLLDDIELPVLIKTDNEKLYFQHKNNITIPEIETFIHRLSGLEFEQVQSKVNIYNPSKLFIDYLLGIEDLDPSILKEKKYLEILDALTKGPKLKTIPVSLVNINLGGADINASTYTNEIQILKHFGIVETKDSGDNIIEIKLTNNNFYKSIKEAKSRFSPYWKEYFLSAIDIEVHH